MIIHFLFLVVVSIVALLLPLPDSGAYSADIRMIQSREVDSAHNGSIDLDITMGSNLQDDERIICNLILEGLVQIGDLDKLKNAVNSDQYPRLCLNSPGGSYKEALRIAKFLMDESIGTAVMEKDVCASACAIIFMAGSAPWKGRLNRFMHPSSILAFHAPYLPGTLGRHHMRGDIAVAFQAGIRAINRLIRLAEGTVPNFFPNDLLRAMLDKGPNETYAIDTVGKAIRYRIHLFGGRTPPLTESNFCNACVNYFYKATGAYARGGDTEICTNRVSRPQARSFPQGLRLEFDLLAPRGGACVVDLEKSSGTIKSWFLHPHYPERNQFGRTGYALTLAYWYLYSAHTPLAQLVQPSVAASSARYTPPRPHTTQPVSIEQQIRSFVEDDYIGTAKTSHVENPDIFATYVHYYAKGVVPRIIVLSDKASYYKKWPYRRYNVIPGTMRITTLADGHYDASVEYTFEVANRKRRIRGHGVTKLRIRTNDNQYQITREDGKVLRRW